MRLWRYKELSSGLLCLLLVTSIVAARDVPSGTISLSATSMAAGVGAQWGDGTLTLNNGKTYRFTVQGLEVGGVGFADLHAQGTVYNLRRVSILTASMWLPTRMWRWGAGPEPKPCTTSMGWSSISRPSSKG